MLCICTVFAFVFLLCLAGFFLWLNRKDQVPMLAVEIPCGALVSHRGTDSRHDSPTEFRGGGRAMGGRELIGHQTNMNNSRFEEMKLVYSSDEMCPTFDVFFFSPGD